MKHFLMKKAIVFDLDNTLVDTKFRHYTLFCRFLLLHKKAIPSYSTYLTARIKGGVSNKDLIDKYFFDIKANFEEFWLKNIENMHLLDLDTEIVGYDYLYNLKSKYFCDFFLASFRSNHTNAISQFSRFHFSNLFDSIYFLNHKIHTSKSFLLSNLKQNSDILYFISDTVQDKKAAVSVNTPFIGVETGFYSFEDKNKFIDINHLIIHLLNERKAKS